MVYGPGGLAGVVFQVAQGPSVDINLADCIGVAAQGPKRRAVGPVLGFVGLADDECVRSAVSHFRHANDLQLRSSSLIIDDRKNAAPPAANAEGELRGLAPHEIPVAAAVGTIGHLSVAFARDAHV